VEFRRAVNLGHQFMNAVATVEKAPLGFLGNPPRRPARLVADDALADFAALKEAEVAIPFPRLQAQIELLLRPESEHVGFDDLGLGEWVFDVPTVFLSTRQPFQDAVTFVMAHPYDLGEGAGRIPVRIHEGEHRLNLEILCAPALLPIRRAL